MDADSKNKRDSVEIPNKIKEQVGDSRYMPHLYKYNEYITETDKKKSIENSTYMKLCKESALRYTINKYNK